MLRAIVTDIEGTTCSIAFVHDVLFPFARTRMHDFVRTHAMEPAVRDVLAEVDHIEGRSLSIDEAGDALVRWIDEDRKLGALKQLQGMVWRGGYAAGELVGDIYPDVPDELRRWRDGGMRLYVYSSGSEESQRLIFRYSRAGDLSGLFAGYFDTRVGGKREPISYDQIARMIDAPVSEILFLSDLGAELDAARVAGMQTCQLARDGTTVRALGHPSATDFARVSALTWP